MKKEYWFVLLTQVIYVIIGLFTAIILWKFLPKVNTAVFDIGPFRGGGSFAGFAFVLWFLHNKWPIEEVKKAVQSIRAGIILTPSRKEEYNALFDGFEKCGFYAFNPPFKLEQENGYLFGETLRTHRKRYLKDNVIGHYLFFDKESYDRAKKFFQSLKEDQLERKKLEKNIKIVYWKDTDKPSYSFFIGYKRNRAYCIFYPSATMQGGIPQAIIYIEGADDFLGILYRHFWEKWNEAIKTSG